MSKNFTNNYGSTTSKHRLLKIFFSRLQSCDTLSYSLLIHSPSLRKFFFVVIFARVDKIIGEILDNSIKFWTTPIFSYRLRVENRTTVYNLLYREAISTTLKA